LQRLPEFQCPTSVYFLVAVYDSLQKYNQLLCYCVLYSFLQRFDTAGWVTGMALDAVCSVFCTKSCTGWMFLSECSQTLHNCSPVSAVQSSTVHDRMLHTDLRHCPSAASTVCQLPSAVVPRHCRSKFGSRAFSVAGLMAWNLLLDTLRDMTFSFDSFRHDLTRTDQEMR